jgi:hypothetical protein
MGFEAQDPINLTLLRIVGAVFACAGLWLLLRPKPSGTTAKIELFGLKFESSSAGVLVFLIGAAFLAVPLFVPEKAVVRLPDGIADDSTPLPNSDGGQVQPPAPPDGIALILPGGPEIAEAEPNDRLQIASRIQLGQTVSGEVRKGNDDWFVVAVPEGPAFVELRVRNVGGGTISARFLDTREANIGKVTLFDRDADTIRADAPENDRFYVWVWKDDLIGVTGTYEFTVLPVAD